MIDGFTVRNRRFFMIDGFTVRNRLMKLARLPAEDAYAINHECGAFAVADGVTRDPCLQLPDLNTLAGKLKWFMKYPRKSPAAAAAQIFVRQFTSYSLGYSQKVDMDDLRRAFEEANHIIRHWNSRNIPAPDYLTKDLAGCVGAGAVVIEDLLYCGYIADSGVAVFDSTGEVRFRTRNEGPSAHEKYFWEDAAPGGWNNPDNRAMIRGQYRNNPRNEHSFGVFTGEGEAMRYTHRWRIRLEPADTVILYTDGLEKTVFSGDFKLLVRDTAKVSEEAHSVVCNNAMRDGVLTTGLGAELTVLEELAATSIFEGNMRNMMRLCQQNVKTEGALVCYHA